MNMVRLYLHRLYFHPIFRSRPPQQSLAFFPLVLVRQRPLPIFHRPNEMIPTIENGVTTSLEHRPNCLLHREIRAHQVVLDEEIFQQRVLRSPPGIKLTRSHTF